MLIQIWIYMKFKMSESWRDHENDAGGWKSLENNVILAWRNGKGFCSV